MADINTKYSGVFGDAHLLYNAYVKPNIIPMTAVFIGVWFISPSASSAIQNGYNFFKFTWSYDRCYSCCKLRSSWINYL
jgi:hypothetical protein